MAMTGYGSAGSATASEAAKETLPDQFGNEISNIGDLTERIRRAADRIYGNDAPKVEPATAPTPITYSLTDRLSELRRARQRLEVAVDRLTTGL